MAKTNEVSLEQVRAVAEKIAREHRSSILDVTVRDIQSVIERGSAGYLGAYLQTIKTEAIEADKFDTQDISQTLKAALHSELKRVADNARDHALATAKVNEVLFQEICQHNEALEKILADTQAALQASKSDSITKLGDLEASLAKARDEKKELEIRLTEISNSRDKSENQYRDAMAEFSNLKAELTNSKASRSSLEAELSKITSHLERSEKDRESAAAEISRTKQHADLLSLRNDDMTTQIQALKEELGSFQARAYEAEALLKTMASQQRDPKDQNPGKSASKTASPNKATGNKAPATPAS